MGLLNFYHNFRLLPPKLLLKKLMKWSLKVWFFFLWYHFLNTQFQINHSSLISSITCLEWLEFFNYPVMTYVTLLVLICFTWAEMRVYRNQSFYFQKVGARLHTYTPLSPNPTCRITPSMYVCCCWPMLHGLFGYVSLELRVHWKQSFLLWKSSGETAYTLLSPDPTCGITPCMLLLTYVTWTC